MLVLLFEARDHVCESAQALIDSQGFTEPGTFNFGLVETLRAGQVYQAKRPNLTIIEWQPDLKNQMTPRAVRIASGAGNFSVLICPLEELKNSLRVVYVDLRRFILAAQVCILEDVS